MPDRDRAKAACPLFCSAPRADALAAFRAAERLAGRMAAPHSFARPVRAWLLHALIAGGETESAGQALARLGAHERERGPMRITAAILRLAQDDPRAALAVLAPVLSGSSRVGWRAWLVEAFLLAATAIAAELSLSRNTIKTHTRNLYAKLGTHRRTEAVAYARELGLLAGSSRSFGSGPSRQP